MRRDAGGCWRRDGVGRGWQAWLLLACLFGAVPQAGATAVHVREGAFQLAPEGTFGPVGDKPALNETAWKPAPLPYVLPRSLAPTGDAQAIDTAWFRIAAPVDATGGPGLRRFYLPRWQTIGQIAVYADERLIYRSSASAVWNGFNHPLWLALDSPGDSPAREVWVRIDHLRSAGLALSSVWMGDEKDLQPGRWWRTWLQTEVPYLASIVFLVIGLFALGVWAVRREAMYGLFFAASALSCLRSLHYHMGLEALPVPDAWFGWMTVNTLSWLIVSVYFFGFRLHDRRYPRLETGLLLAVAATTLVSMPSLAVLPSLVPLMPLAYLAMLLALAVFASLGLWSAWSSRSRDALLIAAVNFLSLPAAVHDLLLQNYLIDIERPYLLPYTGMGLFAAFLFVVLRRYVGALQQSSDANLRLEQRLREREAELDEYHGKLRTIEREQVLAQERDRLMQDMHDGLGSSLMGALRAVEYGHEQDLARVLRECIEDLKLAIDSLEPVQADLLLLLAALRFRLGSRLEQAGIRLHWQVRDVPPLPWLDARNALHILRILQEVLGNAVRHSGAANVTLSTRHESGSVLVTAEDDGQGFALPGAGGGRGMGNVRRRAQAIGATAVWSPQPQGTRFELVLPLAPREKAPGLDPDLATMAAR